MKQSMTGTGKLSSKLLATLVIGIYSQLAGAQASTGPNKVYIEQIGSTNTVTIQQVGGTNNVGGVAGNVSVASTGVTTMTPTAPSASNYATINGSTNTVAITQTGDNNSAQYNIKGSNNAYTSTITGNNNQSKLTMGDTNTNTLRSTVTETVTGNNNLLIQNVVGNDITSTTTIQGSDNQVTKNLSSTNGISSLSITGSNNVINAQQVDAAGANGHVLTNVISGDYNSVTTQQQGSNDTTIDMKTTGNHNTITVRTSSSAISLPGTAIAR